MDGRSFAPQLAGEKGRPREWIFCHYDPRGANSKFARYEQDERYKLYHDGVLYDYRQDPQETSPLPPTGLASAQEASRRKLQSVLDTLR